MEQEQAPSSHPLSGPSVERRYTVASGSHFLDLFFPDPCNEWGLRNRGWLRAWKVKRKVRGERLQWWLRRQGDLNFVKPQPSAEALRPLLRARTEKPALRQRMPEVQAVAVLPLALFFGAAGLLRKQVILLRHVTSLVSLFLFLGVI